MRKTIRVIVFVLLLAAAYTACQRASEEKRSEAAPDSVVLVYNTLSDSVTRAWKDVSAVEEGKLSDMKRLLQEISYTPRYDKARYDSLWNKLQQVYALRFEAETMTSEQIDKYDSAVISLQSEVLDFARSHPDFEQYPLMEKLTDTIEGADQSTLFLRVRYDNYAKDYNDFLKGNKGRLITPLDTALPLKERPLFQLSE